MKDFKNRNPLRRQAVDFLVNDATVELEKTLLGRLRSVSGGIAFLIALVLVLSGVVWHFSSFSTFGSFLLQTEESNSFFVGEEKIEYQRLLVRSQFPFVLNATVRLCRVEGTNATPFFTVLDTQYSSFTGTRSWYSGTLETRLTIVASDDGRFTVTDRVGEPQELLHLASWKSDTSEGDELSELPGLPPKLANKLARELRESTPPGISEIRKNDMVRSKTDIICSLPGKYNIDKVIVLTLTPSAKVD
jgi:hypothetical protein